MVRRAARGKAFWPALLATAAVLLAAPQAFASLPVSSSADLLAARGFAIVDHCAPNTATLADDLEDLVSSLGAKPRRVFSLDLDTSFTTGLSASPENQLGADKPRFDLPSFALFGSALHRPAQPPERPAAAPSPDRRGPKPRVGAENLDAELQHQPSPLFRLDLAAACTV